MNRVVGIAFASLILAFTGAEARASNLVFNGDFEASATDLTGWNISGNGVGIDQIFPSSGVNDAIFTAASNDSPGILSQAVTTSPSNAYQLSFSALDESGLPTDSLLVNFGSFSVAISGLDAGAPGNLSSSYTSENFFIPSTDIIGSSTTLSFQGLNDPTFGQAWNLDDVSLTAVSGVPEPSSWLLILAGIGATGVVLRKARRVTSCEGPIITAQ